MAQAKLKVFLSSKHGLLLVGFLIGVGVTFIGVRGYQKFSHSQLRLPAQAVEAVDVDVELIPVHIANLSSHRWYERNDVAQKLGKIGPAAVEAVPKLIALLKDPDLFVPASAATALGLIGDPTAVPGLIEVVETATALLRSNVRQAAIEALGELAKMQPMTPEAASALAGAWLDGDANVRSRAATVLEASGPGVATAAAPTFIDFLQNSSKWDWPQIVACRVILAIGTEDTLPRLQNLARQKNLNRFIRDQIERVIAAIAARTGT